MHNFTVVELHYFLKRRFAILLFVLALAVGMHTSAEASPIGGETESDNPIDRKTEKYISYVYSKIKFSKNGKLNFDVFKVAFRGYLNMLAAGKISKENVLSICDFTLSSNKKRLWVIDVKAKKVLHHSLVAHGMGTGEEYATCFSNINESHQSSLGFYVTSDTYMGNNGYSMRLEGVDGVFNCNAFERAIVVHGADYVSESFARENNRLGRSHGCPALPMDLAPAIIDNVKNGSCFFIYHTVNNYLSKSRWINSPVCCLPTEADCLPLNEMEVNNNPRYVQVKSSAKDTPDGQQVLAKAAVKNKVISSVMIINVDSRTGQTDTTCVK